MNNIKISKEFLIELCRYYMEFLETDFKKLRNPKRKIQFFENDLVLGIPLILFPKFNKAAIRTLLGGFSKNEFVAIGSSKNSLRFSDSVISGIKKEYKDISKNNLEEALLLLEKDLARQKVPHTSRIIEKLRDSLLENIKKTEFDPFSYLREYNCYDLYQEIYELEKTKEIKDKQEHYLYFYHLKFDSHTYPVFYSPINIAKDSQGNYHLELANYILLNKRALEFASQKFREKSGSRKKIKIPALRQVYVGGIEENYVKSVVDEIIDYFELDKPKDISDFDVEKGGFRFSADSDISVFDTSDESILNDYEELLRLAAEEGAIFEGFTELANDFLFEEPEKFNLDIDEEYGEMPVSKRLSYSSPIPLNEEQFKILEALRNESVKSIVVEGPPGTGKSHTITAILFDAVLKNKSVLMLSDKKEALDVVEDKISQVINSLRPDEKYIQNPILRLGKKDNNFTKIFKQSNLQTLKDRYIAHKRNKELLDKEVEKRTSKIIEDIENEVENMSNLDAQKLYRVITQEPLVKKKWGKMINFEEMITTRNTELLSETFEIIKTYSALGGKYTSHFPLSVGAIEQPSTVGKIENSMASLSRIAELNRGLSAPKTDYLIVARALSKAEYPLEAVTKLKTYADKIIQIANTSPLNELFGEKLQAPLEEKKDIISNIFESLKELYGIFSHQLKNKLLLVGHVSKSDLPRLEDYVKKIKEVKKPLFGLFSKKIINETNAAFIGLFPSLKLERPDKQVEVLEKELGFYKLLFKVQETSNLNSVKPSSVSSLLSAGDELINLAHQFLKYSEEFETQLNHLAKLKFFKELSKKFEKTYEKIITIEKIVNYIEEVGELDEIFSSIGFESKRTPNSIEFHLKHDNNEMLVGELAAIKEFVSQTQLRIANLKRLQEIQQEIPHTLEGLKIDAHDIKSIFNNSLSDVEEEDFNRLKEYIGSSTEVQETLSKLPISKYRQDRLALEKAFIHKMTYILDNNVVNFMERHGETAKAVRDAIRQKRQLSKKDLHSLVTAFPAIIVGIRELGDFLPLAPELFDIVIIDEASQVSIAQAFPAILRAKKVVILGDTKQFSNVKTSQASVDENDYAFGRVKKAYSDFLTTLERDDKEWAKNKVERFDIRRSVLEFLNYLANYQTMLRKHFRSYNEIVGYSNKHFYQDKLQVMKIRTKSIQEVIQIHRINADQRDELLKNTNPDEKDYIIERLLEYKKSDKKVSVGIITPFTNQQQLILSSVLEHSERDYFLKELNVKVMTFDSCQGEERDVIYYSFVAKEPKDKLWTIFPKSFKHLDDEEEGSLKGQRLNVGFSRAKEEIHLVLSKEIDDISGEIGNALKFYKKELEETRNELKSEEFESEMEKYLWHLVQQTKFYKDNKQYIEVRPQFKIGEYIKQLAKREVNIPDYRADFLFIYRNPEAETTQTVIMEYDGFEYHFKNSDLVNELNFDRFYVEEDIERQKIIESYGYDFIRVNKFLLRNNPIEVLDSRLREALGQKKNLTEVDTLTEHISHASGGALDNKETAKFDRFLNNIPWYADNEGGRRKIVELDELRDRFTEEQERKFDKALKKVEQLTTLDIEDLKIYYSSPRPRKNHTKSKKASGHKNASKKKQAYAQNQFCPNCGSPMVKRTGRYGEFYGCSKYPFCKGTRKI